MDSTFARVALMSSVLLLAACGGGGGGNEGNGGSGGGTPPAAFTVGGSASGVEGAGLTLQINGTSDVNVIADGPFTFAALPAGTAYTVTVRSQPTSPGQTCTVANASGTVGTGAVTNVAVSCRRLVAKFLYVPNKGSNNVSAYSIDPGTGSLSPVQGSPFGTAVSPLSIGPNPNQAFLYVTSSGQILPSTQTTPSVSGYSVNSSTGALVEVPGSPFFLQGSSPASNSSLSIVGFEASGRFAYVTANTAGSMAVHGLSADASTGTLTALPSSPFTFVSDGSASVPGVFDATAKHFYVPHGSSNGAVAVFDFDSTTGALMPNSVPAVPTGGNTPLFASRHPSGRYLYVTNLGSNSIAHFNLDATTGILTSINGSPVATGGAFPVYATVHPTGRFVFAANSNFATINGGIPTVAAFDVDQTTGALRPVAGSPFPTGGSNALGDTSLCVVEPRGRFLYVSNSGSNSITAFSIDQTTGALSAVTGSPFATGARPSTVVPDPSGKFLYAVNRDAGSVSSYMIDAVTGALTLVSTQPTGTTPLSVLVFGLR